MVVQVDVCVSYLSVDVRQDVRSSKYMVRYKATYVDQRSTDGPEVYM